MFADVLNFLVHHWALSGAFLACLVLFFWYEHRYQLHRSQEQISPAQLVQKINRDEVVVIDIRDREQYQQGTILGAVHLPTEALLRDPTQLKRYAPKGIVLLCTSGVTAGKVQAQLSKDLSIPVMYLNGGLAAWRSADYPVKTI